MTKPQFEHAMIAFDHTFPDGIAFGGVHELLQHM